MATARRRQRFTGSENDVSTTSVDIANNRKIYTAILNSTKNDIATLREGLEKELKADAGMKATWTAAKTWFANHKPTYKTLQTSHPDEYHIALITFTMDGFYDTFNQACRSIKNEKEAAVFRYRHYYKLLLYCIVHVRGNPPQVSKDLVVYRGCSASFPTVKVGSTFTFRQFTSTSTNKEVATGFSSGGTLFVIHDIMKAGLVTGKAMGINSAPNIIGCNHHSLFDEDEFLMWSLEEFEVIHIVKTGENTEIHLRA